MNSINANCTQHFKSTPNEKSKITRFELIENHVEHVLFSLWLRNYFSTVFHQVITSSARGAKHYHILLWIDGAPAAGKDDADVVLQWIQERITCRIQQHRATPAGHQVSVPQVQQLLSSQEESRERFHHTLSVWVPQTDTRE